MLITFIRVLELLINILLVFPRIRVLLWIVWWLICVLFWPWILLGLAPWVLLGFPPWIIISVVRCNVVRLLRISPGIIVFLFTGLRSVFFLNLAPWVLRVRLTPSILGGWFPPRILNIRISPRIPGLLRLALTWLAPRILKS